MVDAKEEDFELVVLDDIPALFTNSRVDRGSIPDGAYCYDVRHDDCCQGIACEIKPHIMVNHWGTIIARQDSAGGWKLLSEGRFELSGQNYDAGRILTGRYKSGYCTE